MNDAVAEQRTGPLDWAGVLLICLCAVLAAGFEALLVPLYAGSVPIPVAVVLALASNVAFPLLARNLVPTLLATGLPFMAWLVVMIGFGVFSRPEGDIILPGGSIQWVSYSVILGGALAGTITVVTAAPPAGRRARDIARSGDAPVASKAGQPTGRATRPPRKR